MKISKGVNNNNNNNNNNNSDTINITGYFFSLKISPCSQQCWVTPLRFIFLPFFFLPKFKTWTRTFTTRWNSAPSLVILSAFFFQEGHITRESVFRVKATLALFDFIHFLWFFFFFHASCFFERGQGRPGSYRTEQNLKGSFYFFSFLSFLFIFFFFSKIPTFFNSPFLYWFSVLSDPVKVCL